MQIVKCNRGGHILLGHIACNAPSLGKDNKSDNPVNENEEKQNTETCKQFLSYIQFYFESLNYFV